MAHSIEDKVSALVKEKIADRDDLFVVDVNMQANGTLEVLVDGDQGISIQDCAAISRFVGFQLEEGDVIPHAYRLEVSSPGIDRPLSMERQYRKNIGRAVQVSMPDGATKTGKLLEVADGAITIVETIKEKGRKAVEEQQTIPLENITTIKVLISFK
ncbi:ribosome assembly cofactor RimP [Parapedobacter sp. 10938]|uniref:ribosome assembly cofactor RimP n=1 Tax=Parapedobacter flavus TaxID=3110225 RepID=UPI002DB80BB2|nr:ribosome assembly cofactor RimP [Parapedobacter sp. 10938]MEC3881699.1 ribosome assembly cofactor RimP [Parapedobacter sp. 10938]